ncbi:MAG TPA: YdcF family protein [Streptosporangiaceae bacterium]|nr:YdcF family protein [Streptosporangiaceae bacterium]
MTGISSIDRWAKVVWDYLCLNTPIRPSTVVLGLGSHEIRVAERAAQLFLAGYGEHLMFSGGYGLGTSGRFTEPEAQVFARRAIQLGVPADRILAEETATNTGANITLGAKLLAELGMHPQSILLVTKPYMERRALATYQKQWPSPQPWVTVTSPQIDYDHYFAGAYPKSQEIRIMLGDMLRIKEYPKLGYQIEQEIPPDVWSAYEQLVRLGYGGRAIVPPPQDTSSALAV